ncbi:TonB-dependent receptor [Colwelliaceae bacterium BS250]
MSRRTKVSLAIIAALSSSAFISTSIFAEENAIEEVEVIEVTGLRNSIRSAIESKRDMEGITENLSIEDIGKLPERNIADALQRLAGVTGSNDRARSNEISIRGLGGAFGMTTVNGRQVASGSAARSVNLDVYPSETIGGASVAKTASAAQIDGGISGAVNLETIKPLVLGDYATVKVDGIYSDLAADAEDMDGFGQRISGVISRKFADGKIGVLLGGSYIKEDNVAERYTTGRYQGCDWDSDGVLGDWDACPKEDGETIATPSYAWVSGVSAELERKSLNAMIEWEVNDDLKVTVDGLYSKFEADGPVAAIGVNLWPDLANVQVTSDGNGNPIHMETANASLEPANARENYWNETKNLGLNIDYKVGDFIINADLSYSNAPSFNVWENITHDSQQNVPVVYDWATGSGGSPAIYIDPSVDYQSSEGRKIVQYGKAGLNNAENTITALKLDVNYEVDGDFISSIDFGTRLAEMEMERKFNAQQVWMDGIDAEMFASDFPLPKIYSDLGLGDRPNNWIYARPQDVGAYLEANGLLPENERDANDYNNSYEISEKTYAFYAKMNFYGNLGSIPFQGQAGVRYVKTELESDGFELDDMEVVTDPETGIITKISIPDDAGYVPTSAENDYDHILPSVSINFELHDEVNLRVAAAQTILRPDLLKMTATRTIWPYELGDGQQPNPDVMVGTSGNPYLEPIEADQLDISLEWYPREGTYIAIAPFYKDLDAFFTTDGWDTPTKIPFAGDEYYFKSFSKNKEAGGELTGLEISGHIELDMLPGWLANFSIGGNYTTIDIDLTVDRKDGPAESLTLPTNMSESSYGVGLYYDDDDKFSASMYLYGSGDFPIEDSNGTEFYERQSFKSLSASASYDIFENLTVSISGQNLTDETQDLSDAGQDVAGGARDHWMARRTVIGRSYTLGVQAKF